MSDRYGLPTSIFRGISYAESLDGRWIWSDSNAVVTQQAWWTNYSKQWKRVDGDMSGWCVGRFQVLVATARHHGYKGTVDILATNVFTNAKYCAEVLAPLWHRHANKHWAISAYNAGYPTWNNVSYVRRVWTVYTQRMPGGWYGD